MLTEFTFQCMQKITSLLVCNQLMWRHKNHATPDMLSQELQAAELWRIWSSLQIRCWSSACRYHLSPPPKPWSVSSGCSLKPNGDQRPFLPSRNPDREWTLWLSFCSNYITVRYSLSYNCWLIENGYKPEEKGSEMTRCTCCSPGTKP